MKPTNILLLKISGEERRAQKKRLWWSQLCKVGRAISNHNLQMNKQAQIEVKMIWLLSHGKGIETSYKSNSQSNIIAILLYCFSGSCLRLLTIPPHPTHSPFKYTLGSCTFYKENDLVAPSAQLNSPMIPIQLLIQCWQIVLNHQTRRAKKVTDKWSYVRSTQFTLSKKVSLKQSQMITKYRSITMVNNNISELLRKRLVPVHELQDK